MCDKRGRWKGEREREREIIFKATLDLRCNYFEQKRAKGNEEEEREREFRCLCQREREGRYEEIDGKEKGEEEKQRKKGLLGGREKGRLSLETKDKPPQRATYHYRSKPMKRYRDKATTSTTNKKARNEFVYLLK